MRPRRTIRDLDHGDDVLHTAVQAGQVRGFGSSQRGLERPLDGRFEGADFVSEAAGGGGSLL